MSFGSIREKIKEEGYTDIERHPFAVWFGTSLVTVLIVELLSRKSLVSLAKYIFLTPHLFLINFLIVLTTYSFMFVTRRWGFARGVAAVFWGIVGVTDFVLLMFRTTPFTWHDLSLIDSAMQVLNHYVSGIGYVLIIVLLAACVGLLVYLFRRAKRLNGRLRLVRGFVFVAISLLFTVYFWFVGRNSDILPRNFSNIAQAYQTYGFAYCFTNSMISTGISKPEKYDDKTVENIMKDDIVPESSVPVEELTLEAETAGEEESKADQQENAAKPNIIFLQLESFFDITELSDAKISEDPIPYYRSLLENYSSGFLSVPSVGAGTANTEFEILTGMNLDFFGCGEYPYQTVLREQTCESLAYVFDGLNYSTHAIHNNSATFYSRNTVFSRLGFESFTSLEYMYGVEYTPGDWAKDKVLTQNIIDALDSTEENDFIYTISVQGHGSYPTDEVENAKIKVTLDEEDEDRQNQLTYYANEINEMDDFVKELTAVLSEYDEPCILVMYGDHLPSLGIEETELSHGDLFQTKYVVWSNFEMEKMNKDLEAYQLGAWVLGRMGIQEGIMFRYHQKYFQEENPSENNYLDSMAVIEYDMLYGDQTVFGGENPYKPTKLKMGTLSITLDNAVYNNGKLILDGSNFNEFSIAIINGKQYEPEKYTRTRLTIDVELDGENEICVGQQDNYGKTILSTTSNIKLNIEEKE